MLTLTGVGSCAVMDWVLGEAAEDMLAEVDWLGWRYCSTALAPLCRRGGGIGGCKQETPP